MHLYQTSPLVLAHNVRNFIRTLPTDLLLCYPTHSSFHNLCDDAGLRVPPSLRSLLGLGLNFCLKPNTPSKPPHVDYERFIKDYHRRIMFSNAPEKELDGDLYFKNDEFEPIAPECPDLYWRGQSFETTDVLIMLRHFAPTKTTGCHTFKKRLIASSYEATLHPIFFQPSI